MTIQANSQRSSKAIQNLAMIAISLLLIFTSISHNAQAQTKAPYDKATLIAGLKQSARDKKLSQEDFVHLIEQRGVDFQMTSRDEGELRIAGASNEVIAAIRQNYRHVPKRLPKGTGSLTINSSMPDCKVLINGQPRGTTDSNGVLTLPPLKADQYKILLRRQNYEDQARSVQVTAGVESSESFTMAPLKGSLTIVSVPSGAGVSVQGMDYAEGVKNLALAPGNYNLRVSKPGYKSVERVATIEPGQPLSISVIMEVFRVEEMLKESMDSFTQRNFPRAIAISRDILSSKPDEPKANLVLGLSYFNSGNYDAAVGVLVKAISLGEQVQIPVQRHTKFGIMAENDNLTPGVLIIGKNLLEFRPAGGTPAFSVPFDKVYRVIQEDNRGGRVQIKVGNPTKKKDGGKDYNFHPIQAGLHQVAMGTSVAIAIYCENCLPITQAIYQIVQQVKSSSETGIPAKL
jgi:hypothetical protein